MLRPSISRRFVVLAIAATAGAGVGVGAWAAWGANAQPAAVTQPAATFATAPSMAPSTPAPPSPATAPSSPLTLDQAKAVATQASPGTVVEAQQDDEPTGVIFDVTVQHADGTTTDVEVDAATGHVVSTQNGDAPDTPDAPDGH